MKFYDVCIIGGGAAGLSAAASFNDGIKVCILEKNAVLGRKILATGGGKCNITNAACPNKDMVLDFFSQLGLECHCDDEGRYYPYSNQASDVVKAITDRFQAKRAVGETIDISTEFTVSSIVREDMFFKAFDAKGRVVCCKTLILATGGKAAPRMGTTGDGYGFARALGHNIKKVYPVLTGINCGDMKAVKGVRARGRVSLYKDGKLVDSQKGEIQFNEDGISGICVMNLTLHITSEDGESLEDAFKRYEISLDLAPDFDEVRLAERKSSFGILSDRLSRLVDIREIKDWRLPIKGIKGWKDAQCTAGGVVVDEIDMDTMGSKLVPGLYFAGEILDIQGPCGGFNLQNAWETGMRAADSIGKSLRNQPTNRPMKYARTEIYEIQNQPDKT